MHLRRFEFDTPAVGPSYLVADQVVGAAAVVDPSPNVDLYEREAARLGVQIRYVFLTKASPDLAANSRLLRQRTGASVYVGRDTEDDNGFTTVKDGDVIEIGDMRLCVVQVNGRPGGCICLLVYNLTYSDCEPVALLTDNVLLTRDTHIEKVCGL